MTSFNYDLERVLLGALMLEPTYMPDVMPIITSKEMFADEFHAATWCEILNLYNEGVAVDLYTVSMRPSMRPHLQELAAMTQVVDSGAHIVSHAHAIASLYISRRLEVLGVELVARVQKQETSPEDIITWTQRTLDSILGVAAGSSAPIHIREVVNRSLKEAEQRQRDFTNGTPTGVTTGLHLLDQNTGGWKGGELITVAARPGMGKTALMLHFARSAAMAQTPVVIFALEMSATSLGNRMILSTSEIDGRRFKSGNITSDDWIGLEQSLSTLKSDPIYICDDSNISMQVIKSKCKQLHNKGRCGMVVIDYLQLLDTSGGNRFETREREVAVATRQAKQMAKELDIPVMILCQLSREVERRSDKTPIISDLRESGAIEQDSDVVIFIHRPAVYGETEIVTPRWGSIATEGLGVLTVAKQREGGTGKVYFSHSKDLNKITNYGF